MTLHLTSITSDRFDCRPSDAAIDRFKKLAIEDAKLRLKMELPITWWQEILMKQDSLRGGR